MASILVENKASNSAQPLRPKFSLGGQVLCRYSSNPQIGSDPQVSVTSHIFFRGSTVKRLIHLHTSQNSFNEWTKISSLEIIIFELINDGKKLSRIYFEIHRAPSEIPVKLPGQFGHSGQIFLHWAAATLKGSVNFTIKSLDHFLPSFLSKKW